MVSIMIPSTCCGIQSLRPSIWTSSAFPLNILTFPSLIDMRCSASGSGLHTTGIVGFVWTSLDKFTPQDRHAAIYAKMREAYDTIDEREHPGIKEVFKLRMERFDPTNPDYPACEFVHAGGFFSAPSQSPLQFVLWQQELRLVLYSKILPSLVNST